MPPADPPPEPNMETEDDLGELCPNCAFGNVPETDFCLRCGAPLSTMATIDPLRSTLAEGFVYRRAVDGSPKPIVLTGVWLVFLPMLVVPVLRAVSGEIRSGYEQVGVALFSLLPTAVLYRATAGFLRARREKANSLRCD